MIEETLAKIETALKEARLADPQNKAKLVLLLEQLRDEVKQEKRREELNSIDLGLRDAAVEFKATHPQLATVVGELSAMLAKIGI